MFASSVTETIITPGDPSYRVTIRKLSGRHLQRAQDATMFTGAELMQQIGGAEVMKQMRSLGSEDEIHRRTERNPEMRFDKPTTIRLGLVDWTDPAGTTTVAADITDDQIADLDKDAEELLFRSILSLSGVAVGEPEAAAQEEQTKNA